MREMSQYCLVAATILVALAAVVNVLVLSARSVTFPAAQKTLVPAGGAPLPEAPVAVVHRGASSMNLYAQRLPQLAFLFLTASLAARTVQVGHAPFSNQYEFAVSFGWGMLAAYTFFEHRYHARSLSLLLLPATLAILLYASTVSSDAAPLVPALQNNILLILHVVTATLAYGAAAVAFAAGALYLIRPRLRWHALPSQDQLDDLGYRAVVLSFPLMTIMIVLGAIWADIAWGRYWSWDPKETASLVTWLIYGAYLHARVVRDWRGRRAAMLLILGFLAILFTYFGNLFFGGMHAYA